MRKYLILAVLTIVLLSGCASLGRMWEVGTESYSSQEGVVARQATAAITQPIVGQPWSTAISSIVGLLVGGYAVYKRKQLLDTPTKQS